MGTESVDFTAVEDGVSVEYSFGIFGCVAAAGEIGDFATIAADYAYVSIWVVLIGNVFYGKPFAVRTPSVCETSGIVEPGASVGDSAYGFGLEVDIFELLAVSMKASSLPSGEKVG